VFPANKGESRGISCRKYRGPSFGICELEAYSEPFNDKDACNSWSWGHGGTYNIGVDSQGRNMLTNKLSEDEGYGNKPCWFTISELEVWEVKMVGGEKKQK
jgi:hypothetical protein